MEVVVAVRVDLAAEAGVGAETGVVVGTEAAEGEDSPDCRGNDRW